MNLNDLSISIYSSGTTSILNPEPLRHAQGISFTTQYPGGLYGSASFYVARNITQPWEVKGGQRVVIRNGQNVVFEGRIDSIQDVLGRDADQGNRINVTGYWGSLLARRRWNKPWCDGRISDDKWKYNETYTHAPKCTYDKLNRIMFIPKAEAWTSGFAVGCDYTAPTGETIKRITLNYDLQEAAQAWKASIYDVTNAFEDWAVTASGAGAQDETLTTASSKISLRFGAAANQTPTADGTYYGKFSSIFVYTELGNIDPTEVIKDIRAKITDLNSTDTYIGTNAMTLTPFRTEGWSETIADLLMRIASYGDAAINDWAVYVRESEYAPTPNGKPVLVYELQPALTDYDYQVSLAELDPPVTIERGFDDIWNWIVIQYTDANGFLTFITPDNDATLKDTTSITDYGQRDYLLTFTSGGSAEMIKYARRFLAARKDPVYRIPGPIQVRGSIMSKSGGMTPVCQVRAGKRIRIMDYLPDLSGTGLTLLISATDYDSSSEVCSITAGVPDSLSVIVAQLGAGLLK